MMTAGIIGLLMIFVISFFAFKNLGDDYQLLIRQDLSEEFSSTIIYDDHLYGMLGFGIMNEYYLL